MIGLTLGRARAGTAAPAAAASAAPSAAAPAAPALVGDLDSAQRIAGFLKALGHEGRLLILAHLAEGERSVTELEALLNQRQSAVSQQLARLRGEGLVQTRRDGQNVFYSLRDPRVAELLALLDRQFAAGGGGPDAGRAGPAAGAG